jgi:multidrug efflux pump subunit AcrA (membrane-fusion protein)
MHCQCVVARRPFRRPASANTKAPAQTDATRLALRAASRIHSATAGKDRDLPVTRIVSYRRVGSNSQRARSAASRRPELPSMARLRVVDTTRCYFTGQIEGRSASSLHLDQVVKIQVDGVAAPVTGKISFISPVVDPASGLAKVKALFENADGKIRPGLAAKMITE